MRKKWLVLALIAVFGIFLASCTPAEPTPEPTPEPVLTAITFAGVADLELEFEAEFNVLTGVTATGNDNKDYTSKITYTSLAPISDTHMLDTTKVGVHGIRYEVKEGTLTAQRWRYITVKAPQAVEGEYLINKDFSQGTAGWDDSGVVYNGDGSSMEMSVEDGMLKTVIVAGANSYTPRFGQMNVPFEQGKAYKVSFDAKADKNKTINLQVGELLTASPWFTDFKTGQTEHRLITTTMARYEYTFIHTQDNKRGGVLFEIGAVAGVGVGEAFTLWFDNIEIEEVEIGADETAPTISGVSNKSALIGSTVDVKSGITAFDVIDGDVTEDLVFVIKNAASEVVTSIDTAAEGIYTVEVSVEDAAGNEATASFTVEIVSMQFLAANKVANGSFESALTVDKPEWALWSQDWGTAPVVTTALDTTAGTFGVDITGGGDAAWAVQLFQDGYITLEQGMTYRLQFTAKAEVARSLSVTFGYGDPYVDYARKNGIAITTEDAVYEFLFTVTHPTHAVKLVFELGSQAGFADGLVTFSDVKLQQADLPLVVNNGNFQALGWQGFVNDWEGSVATFKSVGGEFVYDLTKYSVGGASYRLQLIYGTKLVLEAETAYTFKFDAYASKDLELNPFFTQGEAGGWNNLVTTGKVAITGTKTTYTLTFTTGASVTLPFEFKLEFGDQFTAFETGAEWLKFDNLSLKKDGVDQPELLLNGNAESVIGGHVYDNAGEGVGTMTYGATGAVIEVTTLGSQAYTPHYYYLIDELAAGKYTVVLQMTSSVARDFRFNMVLPNAGWGSILPDTKYDFNVATADQMVTVTVSFEIATALEDIKVELDFGTLGGTLVSTAGTFTLHNILIYQNFN